jgi:hypothetical protein
MLGWARNSRIVVIFRIKIVIVHPNANLFFRNNENSYYFTIPLFHGGNKIAVVLLNSSLLFQTNNQNNISTIRNIYFKQTIQIIFLPFGIALLFYHSHANRKITIISLSSCAIILNFSILIAIPKCKRIKQLSETIKMIHTA